MPVVTLTALHIYPVKGCRGISLESARVDALGLEGDRRFLVIDAAGKFLTQRSHPAMALIETALDANTLTLRFRDHLPLTVPRATDPAAPLLPVEIWRHSGLLAEDCGDSAAVWLTAILGQPARLVRAGAAFHRPVAPSRAQPGDELAFPDGANFLIASEASLADLNDRLLATGTDALPMDRFRPNLVLSGCDAYAEDTWPRFRLGDIAFRSVGPCARCIVTTTDQRTGERRGPEPLRTLALYRRHPGEPSYVDFGQNLVHETKSGHLALGAELTPRSP